MSELTTQLPERLNNTEETGLDAVLLIPLLRLIVEGGPVTVEQFAAAAGRPVDDVRTGLAAVPDTEYDDQGRIIGQGLTLRPTPHRFTVAGEELYTWCALDTLIFPTLLERAASVESVSPTSGEPICSFCRIRRPSASSPCGMTARRGQAASRSTPGG